MKLLNSTAHILSTKYEEIVANRARIEELEESEEEIIHAEYVEQFA